MQITDFIFLRDMSFTIRARECGILLLPDGASREDLVETARVRDFVLKHVRNWYMFIGQAIHHGVLCSNGSLCVVTGHDKAISWAASVARPYNSTGKLRTIRYSKGKWTRNDGMSSQTSDVIAEYDIDHCALFLRTMRFALSTRDWTENLLHNEPPEVVAFYYMPTVPVFGLRAFYQRLKEQIFKKPDESMSDYCNEASKRQWITL